MPQGRGDLTEPFVCTLGETDGEVTASQPCVVRSREEERRIPEQTVFLFQLADYRWSGLGLLQCCRCLCLSKWLWTVFCTGPLNFSGAVDISICGNSFNAVCSLTQAMFHPSSRPFPWGRDDFLLWFVKCLLLCFGRLINMNVV